MKVAIMRIHWSPNYLKFWILRTLLYKYNICLISNLYFQWNSFLPQSYKRKLINLWNKEFKKNCIFRFLGENFYFVFKFIVKVIFQFFLRNYLLLFVTPIVALAFLCVLLLHICTWMQEKIVHLSYVTRNHIYFKGYKVLYHDT